MPAKKINPRLAKIHRSYSVAELASIFDVHPYTVRGWIKAELPTVDDTRPVLILGSEFQDWWGKRTKAKKRPLKPGQFFCLKCQAAKGAAGGMVEYAATNGATANLKAMCETCSTMMHRRTRIDAIAAVMPGLDVARREASSSIIELAHPSLDTDKPMEA